MIRLHIIVALISLVPLAATAADETLRACGNPLATDNGIGPWNYLNAHDRNHPKRIPIVERYHFNSDVQTGRRGQNGTVLGDLHYTLNMVPNHHRALYSLINYHLKHKPIVPFTRSVDCYLQRARTFEPKDGTVHMLEGIYAARLDQLERAELSYQRALEIMPDSAELHYNVGLLYFELGRYAAANEHAVKAYSLGSQLPGLRRKLIRKGAWDPDIIVEARASEAEISGGKPFTTQD